MAKPGRKPSIFTPVKRFFKRVWKAVKNLFGR